MIDRELLRGNLSYLKEIYRKRGFDEINLDELKELDEDRRKKETLLSRLRAEKNEKSKLIGRFKKEGKDIKELLKELKELDNKIERLEEEYKKVKDEFEKRIYKLPNILHESVPEGRDSSDNVIVKQVGDLPKFDFEPKTHWEIGEKLGILDFKSASYMSGSRFVVYKGLGAKLERALINFFLDLHTKKHGYKEVWLPYLLKSASLFNSGHLPFFEDEMYHIEKDKLYLIPTAEPALLNLHANQILKEEDLPLKYVGYTACFRREAGSYGREVRGMIRVHQFNKIELFKFTKPEDSYEELEAMLEDAEEVLKLLNLPYRVVLLCSGDTGMWSAKTYDIEVWSPGVKKWLEVSSVSNVESFQARRAKIRYRKKDGKIDYVHTLNGSGLATPRTFIAIIENYQQKDGRIKIPEALRPYMDGLEYIEPER